MEILKKRKFLPSISIFCKKRDPNTKQLSKLTIFLNFRIRFFKFTFSDCEDINDIERLKALKNNADAISDIMTQLINVQNGAQNKDWNDFRDSIERLSAEAENFQSLLDCSYVTDEYNKIAGKYFCNFRKKIHFFQKF